MSRGLTPEQGWPRTAYVFGQDGKTTVIPLPDEQWAPVLVAASRALRPRAVCVLMTVWAVHFDEHADRPECVVLHALDPEGTTLEWAKVTRHAHRSPTLGAFRRPGRGAVPQDQLAIARAELFGPEPEPITPDQLDALHECLMSMGAAFDGEDFCAFVPIAAPAERTIAVLACRPSVFELSSGRPTGITVEGIEVGVDVAARIKITLFDRPGEPAQFAPVLNPTAEGARHMLRDLARQPVWELVVLNRADGKPVGTRFLPVDEEPRGALRQLLELTAGRAELTPERWQEVAARLSAR